MPHTETFVDGIWHPSVTTIMSAQPKPWLQAWRDKWGILAERKMKAASNVGTEFHKCVDEYLESGVYNAKSRRLEGMMESFMDWSGCIDGIIDSTELKVISKIHKYSGTLDAVGRIGGKRVVIDWKTSSKIYPEMALQLAAYAQAYKEQTGVEIKEGLIVHVSKDKPHHKLTTKSFKLGKRVFKQFLKLREMFDTMQVAAGESLDE
jgi:CRISPR/Cas system-associated exonuclease Cas4 (RecB family)